MTVRGRQTTSWGMCYTPGTMSVRQLVRSAKNRSAISASEIPKQHFSNVACKAKKFGEAANPLICIVQKYASSRAQFLDTRRAAHSDINQGLLDKSEVIS